MGAAEFLAIQRHTACACARMLLERTPFVLEARGTVVVAEERGPVREYVRGLLERALPGVAQVSATCGMDALEVLEALRDESPGPVVLVSGVELSNVDALAEHLWGATAPVSVVLLGGGSSASDRARARALEATLLEGPAAFTQLAETVAELLSPTIH